MAPTFIASFLSREIGLLSFNLMTGVDPFKSYVCAFSICAVELNLFLVYGLLAGRISTA